MLTSVQNGEYLSAGELAGHLCEKAAAELGLPAGIAVGSGVIDAYAGWIGTVGAKITATEDHLDAEVPRNDQSQAFSRLAAVAGTSTCHLAMSKNPVFVPGVWGPYRDVVLPDFWLAEGGQSATGELLRHILDQLRLRGRSRDGATMAQPMRREIRWLVIGRTTRQRRSLLADGSSLAAERDEAFCECYLTWLPANV